MRPHLLLLTTTMATSAVAGKLLEGQRVLVTGGGRGIGRAISLLCAAEGAQVAIVSRSESELQEVRATAAQSGAVHGITVRKLDVTDEKQVDSTIGEIASALGAVSYTHLTLPTILLV